MEKSQKFYLSIVLLLVGISCTTTDKKESVAEVYEHGFKHYQGSPEHMNSFAYALELDSTKAETYRELSVTYLKRGMPHTWKNWYDGAVKYDPETWQPWRGYLYLWFYRDYKKAIADFNASDTLTPHLDYPQGHSVDYWRGIAYLGLNDYKNSIRYWDKHITKETQDTGEDWVEINAFLYRGIAYYETDNFKDALYNFNKILHYFKHSADAKYYKALIYKTQGKNKEALALINDAITDYNIGFYNNRPYVETLRQLYIEDFLAVKESLSK